MLAALVSVSSYGLCLFNLESPLFSQCSPFLLALESLLPPLRRASLNYEGRDLMESSHLDYMKCVKSIWKKHFCFCSPLSFWESYIIQCGRERSFQILVDCPRELTTGENAGTTITEVAEQVCKLLCKHSGHWVSS